MKNTFSKGFTLVELLIVITILAALAAAVVVVLNPGELLAQARDSQRLNDMGVVRDALMLYLTQGAIPPAPTDLSLGAPSTISCSVNHPSPAPGNRGCCSLSTICPAGIFSAAGSAPLVRSAANVRLVNGSGWVDVNLGGATDGMSGGSPLSALPIDPVNSSPNFFYAYIAGGTNPENTFELNTRLESERYRGMMANDGGNRNNCGVAPTWTGFTNLDCLYEIGNDPGLDL